MLEPHQKNLHGNSLWVEYFVQKPLTIFFSVLFNHSNATLFVALEGQLASSNIVWKLFIIFHLQNDTEHHFYPTIPRTTDHSIIHLCCIIYHTFKLKRIIFYAYFLPDLFNLQHKYLPMKSFSLKVELLSH